MPIERFIGKNVDIGRAVAGGGKLHGKGTEYVIELPTLEYFLLKTGCLSGADEHGFSGYSVQLALMVDQIVEIHRVGHVQMPGGQGADEELEAFPHKALEEEAERFVESIIVKK